jgi:ribosomal protein S18 acetylase RimI-like enzyme
VAEAAGGPGPAFEIRDLEGEEQRARAVPIVLDAYTGIYRWHAKRTLREVATVRGATVGGELVGVAMLEPLAPEVGYVYYLLVLASHRGLGIGSRLLDDALAGFRAQGRSIVYVVTGRDNATMEHLLTTRGFRQVARKETSYREGGLGAWGLRSRMRIVPGETLYGLRIGPAPTPSTPPPAR